MLLHLHVVGWHFQQHWVSKLVLVTKSYVSLFFFSPKNISAFAFDKAATSGLFSRGQENVTERLHFMMVLCGIAAAAKGHF